MKKTQKFGGGAKQGQIISNQQ